jgi:hypothetical protein
MKSLLVWLKSNSDKIATATVGVMIWPEPAKESATDHTTVLKNRDYRLTLAIGLSAYSSVSDSTDSSGSDLTIP